MVVVEGICGGVGMFGSIISASGIRLAQDQVALAGGGYTFYNGFDIKIKRFQGSAQTWERSI